MSAPGDTLTVYRYGSGESPDIERVMASLAAALGPRHFGDGCGGAMLLHTADTREFRLIPQGRDALHEHLDNLADDAPASVRVARATLACIVWPEIPVLHVDAQGDVELLRLDPEATPPD